MSSRRLAAQAGRRPTVSWAPRVELSVGPRPSCCGSWSGSCKGGSAVPGLCVGCSGSGGCEPGVLMGENTGNLE